MTSKVALVTGAGKGIGKAIGKKLAEDGYILLLNDLEFTDQARDEFSNYDNVNFSQGDISSFEYAQELSNQAKELGDFLLLVNNAGINRDALIIRMKEEDFDSVINVNLKGTYNMIKAAAKIMMKQRQGRIINMSSIVGVHGNPGQINYAASKAGVIGMTKTAAKELASRNILVNAIAPGFIQTDMTEEIPEDIKDQMKDSIPLGDFGRAEDIAKLVSFLASDDCNYITGQVINIDGGMSI